MPKTIQIGSQGLIIISRMVSAGRIRSAPVQRLIAGLPPDKVLDLTGAKRRQTAVFLDSGHVVLTPLSIAELLEALAK